MTQGYKLTREEYEEETRRIEERKEALENGQVLAVTVYLTFEADQPGDDTLRSLYGMYEASRDIESLLASDGYGRPGIKYQTLKVQVADCEWGKFESGQYGEFVADAK